MSFLSNLSNLIVRNNNPTNVDAAGAHGLAFAYATDLLTPAMDPGLTVSGTGPATRDPVSPPDPPLSQADIDRLVFGNALNPSGGYQAPSGPGSSAFQGPGPTGIPYGATITDPFQYVRGTGGGILGGGGGGGPGTGGGTGGSPFPPITYNPVSISNPPMTAQGGIDPTYLIIGIVVIVGVAAFFLVRK